MAILIIAGLQIGTHPGDRPGPRIPAVAQIEHKSRISHGFSAESGGRGFILAKKFFYLSEQMHHSIPYTSEQLGARSFPTEFLLV